MRDTVKKARRINSAICSAIRIGLALTAAECLWRSGSRDGLKTLVDLLDLRPLETARKE